MANRRAPAPAATGRDGERSGKEGIPATAALQTSVRSGSGSRLPGAPEAGERAVVVATHGDARRERARRRGDRDAVRGRGDLLRQGRARDHQAIMASIAPVINRTARADMRAMGVADAWCPGPESNRHGLRRRILSPLCLPFHHPGSHSGVAGVRTFFRS